MSTIPYSNPGILGNHNIFDRKNILFGNQAHILQILETLVAVVKTSARVGQQ